MSPFFYLGELDLRHNRASSIPANGRAGNASVTAAIGLCGGLRFLLPAEMMTALVFGCLLNL